MGYEETLFSASLEAYEGLIASSRDDPARAEAALTESCELYALRAHSHDPGIALCHYWLARAKMAADRSLEAVLQDLDVGVEAAEKLLDYGADGRANFVYAYGVLHYALAHWQDSGDSGPARAYAQQTLDLIEQQPSVLLEAGFVRLLPILALGILGEHQRAGVLLDDYLSVGLRQAEVIDWASRLGVLKEPLPPPVDLPVGLPESFWIEVMGPKTPKGRGTSRGL